ncbi:MAG: hypothetical protein KUA43_07485 [Hoeflea sp.]|uniref:hypothetical protein n=1 Tax=Hoeflea sp. TaxID=1940281 RepID=UPI001D474A19|nr:hypothetical protein [Hoeflea sp.]MBU4530225.1 hypothetical protein [Alphaproteobacteria bacterium]MBU4542449.1 hypothetical protein [Alphaproteobacteria bacterium]MBU4551135.1 hypothetical protein [Alphaproteobacteria bacterium]MBV1723271.1 hypothetical protein [Hoeflea sp.]MBV1760241.1 hypothetical protein [Hoeflea sp.]
MLLIPDAEHDDLLLGERPLIVCDIDEVVLEFVTPFQAFLKHNGHELRPTSFRLNGNVFSLADSGETPEEEVARLLEAFFAAHDDWQTPVLEAAQSLERLSDVADIVFLTAMPPRHRPVRRRLLSRHGFDFPMIATEAAKGPAVLALHGARSHPVVFIDDIFVNLQSVRQHVPETLLLNLIANDVFRGLAPHPGDGVDIATDWPHAEKLIRAHFASFAP